MAGGGPQLAGVQLLGQREEGQRVLAEVVDVEDRLGPWQVVLGQVVVQAAARRPEVGDSGRSRHAGASHGDDVATLARSYVLDDAGEVDRLQNLQRPHDRGGHNTAGMGTCGEVQTAMVDNRKIERPNVLSGLLYPRRVLRSCGIGTVVTGSQNLHIWLNIYFNLFYLRWW